MIIGLIGFGKVSRNLVNLIDSDEIEFITSGENRSASTVENIKRFNVCNLPTFEEVAYKADILVSATSPSQALEVARKYGKDSKGIYLDLNNVSPETTFEIDRHVGSLVDGAIIGKIDSNSPTLYVSGERASELLFLNDFLNVKVISDRIGDAAILKLLRSSYTKTLTALLIESREIARRNNLEDDFFDIVSLTEGVDFREKSISRIDNTLENPKRKSEELEELINCFDGEDLTMVKAALEKFSRL